MCLICGWIYSEEDGSPDEGIEPGLSGKRFLSPGRVPSVEHKNLILTWWKSNIRSIYRKPH